MTRGSAKNVFFPKTPPELGSRLVFWRKGLGARSAGHCPTIAQPLPNHCPNIAQTLPVPRVLVYAKRPFSSKMTLSSTRNDHFRGHCPDIARPSRSRLRETAILADIARTLLIPRALVCANSLRMRSALWNALRFLWDPQ